MRVVKVFLKISCNTRYMCTILTILAFASNIQLRTRFPTAVLNVTDEINNIASNESTNQQIAR
jgi:hypothetical protein